MQFLTALFGGAENTILTAAFALGIVLVLILIGLWALKFLMRASANMNRGRTKRLAIIDKVQIDSRRQVVILRRDNVEHVIMTGGPADLVVETNIAVERQSVRRPAPVQPQPNVAADDVTVRSAQPLPAVSAQRGPMDRLREVNRPAAARKPTPLRNPSLLRQVGRNDPAVIPMNGYNSDPAATDSATTSPTNETNGQAKLGASSRYVGDALKGK